MADAGDEKFGRLMQSLTTGTAFVEDERQVSEPVVAYDPGKRTTLSSIEDLVRMESHPLPRGGSAPSDEAMTQVTREEIDAKLDAVRADVRANNADLRADFEALRADIAGRLADASKELGHVGESLAQLHGSVDGLKSSIGMLQWVITTIAALGGIWIGYLQLSQSQTREQAQPPAAAAPAAIPPIIINVPPAAPAPAPAASGAKG